MNAYVIPGIVRTDNLIDDIIASAFGVSVDQMKSKRRYRPGTEARQFAMWYREKNTKESLSVIGNRYNGRDHATVLHAKKTVNNLIETNKVFKGKADQALKILDQYK